MLDDAIRYLVCPHCEAALARDGGVLRCARRHTFDIARQGYVSLLPPGARPDAGDTAAMVAARVRFLAAGHQAGLATEVAEAATPAGGVPGCVVDSGAGTGYHLAATLDRLGGRTGLALDVSRPALRRAARAHERIGAVACDAWRRLPVATEAAAVVLNVFAPRDGAELRRILHPDGRLVVVTPTAEHMAELVDALGLLSVDARKEERLAEKLGPHLGLLDRREYRTRLGLDHDAIADAVAMGPSARHTDAMEMAGRIGRLPDPIAVMLSVTISVYRPRAATEDEG